MTLRILQLKILILTIGVFYGYSGWIFPVFPQDRRPLDAPFMVGPQYPLYSLITNFNPDSAFVMAAADVSLLMSQTQSNSFEFSSNSAKADDKNADASQFNQDNLGGYSVYIDVDMRRTQYRLAFGLFDYCEIQYLRQTASVSNGVKMDTMIENFHKNLDMPNYEREQSERGEFAFFVYDNESNEYLMSLMNSDLFRQTLETISVKLPLLLGEGYAISFKASTSRAEYYSEADDVTYRRESYDQNYALLITAVTSPVTLHASASVTYMEEKIFEKSPGQIFYYFLGLNWHPSDDWDIIMQWLQYDSLYPDRDEGHYNMADSLKEFTTGFRYMFTDNFVFEFGMVENYSQGPNNIDVAFFGNLALAF